MSNYFKLCWENIWTKAILRSLKLFIDTCNESLELTDFLKECLLEEMPKQYYIHYLCFVEAWNIFWRHQIYIQIWYIQVVLKIYTRRQNSIYKFIKFVSNWNLSVNHCQSLELNQFANLLKYLRQIEFPTCSLSLIGTLVK